jgi:hypothetical protein
MTPRIPDEARRLLKPAVVIVAALEIVVGVAVAVFGGEWFGLAAPWPLVVGGAIAAGAVIWAVLGLRIARKLAPPG